MIQVLHVVRPAAGGIRQHVLELVRHADTRRFSVSVAGPAGFLHDLPAGLPITDRVLVEIAPRFSPAQDFLAAVRLAQYFGSRSSILVHAHGLRAAFVTALARRLRPFPFVFTAHNLVTQGAVTRFGVRLAAHQANCVIAISQAISDGLKACGISEEKIRVIPNGVDLEWFASPPPILGEQEQKFTVGCVARLSHEKGVDVLLRAAKLMPDAQFLIAGEGPERTKLQALAPPNARILGRVRDPREVYASANVIAIPSRQEGQGIVALEAMASGVSLVAASVGGLAEMLTNGETALLVPPDDPQGLADALTRLYRDPDLRAKLSANGRAIVQKRYEIRRMVEAVQDVYAAMV